MCALVAGVQTCALPIEAAQRLQQALVVALVQADGGLVQHVEHAGKAGADLRGEADALALAAGKAAGAAAERQVVEPDVDQEAQALVDLLQDARRDLLLLWPELAVKGGEPGSGVGDRELRDLADVQAVELHRQGLRLQAEIGRASRRERVCTSGEISVVAVY